MKGLVGELLVVGLHMTFASEVYNSVSEDVLQANGSAFVGEGAIEVIDTYFDIVVLHGSRGGRCCEKGEGDECF